MREPYGSRRATCDRPRVMRSWWQRPGRSVDRGACGPGYGASKYTQVLGRRRCQIMRKAIPRLPQTPGSQGPAGSKNLSTHVDSSGGNREVLGLATGGAVVRAGNPEWGSQR